MAFIDIKNTILDRGKRADICSQYQAILVSTTQQMLVDAGKNLIVWGFRTGIIDDTLLLDCDQTNLNANGIYITGSFTLTDPTLDRIFIFGDAEVELNITSGAYKVFIFSNCTLNLNITGTGYVKVKVFDAVVNVAMANSSLCYIETTNSNSLAILMDTSVLHTKLFAGSNLELTTNNNSYVRHQGFFDSNINVIQNDASEIQLILTQTATKTDGGL